eukprot:3687222-Amphidinium_carterae.1
MLPTCALLCDAACDENKSTVTLESMLDMLLQNALKHAYYNRNWNKKSQKIVTFPGRVPTTVEHDYR